MRRSSWLLLLSAALLLTAMPSIGTAARKEVGKKKVTWNAPLPAFALTPYNNVLMTNQQRQQAGCEREPSSIQFVTGNAAVDGVKAPALPGSFDDIVVKIPPKIAGLRPTVLNVNATPSLDWDLFVCKIVKGRYVFVAVSANDIGEKETAKAVVKPGETFVLRAYNFVDVNSTLNGEFSFLAIPAR